MLNAETVLNLPIVTGADGDEYLYFYDPDGGASRYIKRILITDLATYIKQHGTGYIDIEFSFTFDGTANKGLNGSAITVPNVVIPDNFILQSRILDFSSTMAVSNALAELSMGIATNGATTLLASTVVTGNLVDTFKADAITPIKTTAARSIVMAVGGTGNITAGTVKGVLRGYIGQ